MLPMEENPDPSEEEIRFGIAEEFLPLYRLPEHRQGDPVRRGPKLNGHAFQEAAE